MIKINYKSSQKKVIIICPIHGEFLQTPNDHSQGHGCAKCVRLDKKEYISTNININGDIKLTSDTMRLRIEERKNEISQFQIGKSFFKLCKKKRRKKKHKTLFLKRNF